MSGKIWHRLVDSNEDEVLYPTMADAVRALGLILDAHRATGNHILEEPSREGATVLYIIKDANDNEVARYQVID